MYFLGTAGKINDKDIDEKIVKKLKLHSWRLFMGWGWTKKAFDKAINHSNKVAMSLSDLFCVERHKNHF